MSERLRFTNKTSHIVFKDHCQNSDELVGPGNHHLLISDVVRVRDESRREYAVQSDNGIWRVEP